MPIGVLFNKPFMLLNQSAFVSWYFPTKWTFESCQQTCIKTVNTYQHITAISIHITILCFANITNGHF